ncbi:helix-turn-helix domain-containing protein [Salibacterium sp. K-3]
MVQHTVFKPFQPGHETDVKYFWEQEEYLFEDCIPISFYQFKVNECSSRTFATVPDGCIDILIYCHPRFLKTYVYGHLSKTKDIIFHPEADYFGIRLPFGLHFTLLQASVKEIENEVYEFQDISSTSFEVEENLLKTEDFQDRINLVKQWLLPQLTYSQDPILRQTLQMAYATKGTASIQVLSQDTGYSERYIRKKFSAQFGISPKLFFEVVRFQHSLALLKKYSIHDVLLENGYYDQSHMSNEFKKFGYLTPLQFSKRVK